MHRFLAVIVANTLLAGTVWANQDRLGTGLDTQRARFELAYPAAQRGDVETVGPYLESLVNYPLYPDLLGALLRASLAQQSETTLDAFQQQFPDNPEASLLVRAQLRRAAKQGDWPHFLRLWEQAPQTDTQMRCHFARAQMSTAASANADSAGLALWQVGRSQPKACDPVFGALKQSGKLTASEYQRRLELALAERQFGLATYLARSLTESERQRVRTWQRMFTNPAATLAELANQPDADADAALLEAGLLRLAYRDRDRALALFEQLSRHHQPATELKGRLLRQAALGSAQRLQPHASDHLALVPASAADEKVRRWRVRSALRGQDPKAALRALNGLEDSEAALAESRYWRARVLHELGATDESIQIFSALAQERGFFGFLAADWLDLPYAYGHTPTPMHPTRLDRLATDPRFIRARELFYVGLYGRARQLWEGLMKSLDQADQVQAALLANQWGWHSRAIATATRAGLRHDLRLRFPIPAGDWLDNLPVDRSLVLGVARSESLFMSDVRSSAGAIGLMQLMPATGKEVARKLGVHFRGLQTLVDPNSNARLGSEYLKRMLQRFDQNKVLAAAAYNAGPHRVDRWLPTNNAMAADVWLTTIPYKETRQYVQRVLETATIMQWRMEGPSRRLTEALRPVPASAAGPIAQAR